MKPTKLFLALAVAVLLGACNNKTSNNATTVAESQGITNTYWRDDKTGDWFIGFAEKHVIYDNAVWDIVEQTAQGGGYTLTIRKDNRTREVKVNPMKEGERTIIIEKDGRVKCSPITTSTLPDYSTRDNRQGLKNNGYRMGDSVTIVGWLKDMPQRAWKRAGKEFEVVIQNIIANEQQSFYTSMNSLGQFVLKMPLLNTSQALVDWKRSHINTVLEPGETYFLLVDFSTGQRLFMGTDARLQNELLSYPPEWYDTRMEKRDSDEKEAMDFLTATNNLRNKYMNELQERIKQHPNLSQRYVDYLTGWYQAGLGMELMQGRFSMKGLQVPQPYMDFVGKEIWQKRIKPYTLYTDFSIFKRDYIDQLEFMKKPITRMELLHRMVESGEISLTTEEKRALEDYQVKLEKFRTDFENATDKKKREVLIETFNASEEVKVVNELLKVFDEPIQKAENIFNLRQTLEVLDSVGCDSNLRDLHLAATLYKWIDVSRKPLLPEVVVWMEQEIKLPAAKAAVIEQNNKYLAIQHRDILGSNLKSSDDVKSMSDGEKILRKLIEPYKGKFILLDVWGTWCGPCKRALANSQEEYEHLKDYDIVYLYLANRSDEESWKNVIKEYNVTGDNVVHYNLPTEQQTAIEHFLGVNSFPTYKLIDRDGNILDVNADPRDLNALENLLKMMNGTKN